MIAPIKFQYLWTVFFEIYPRKGKKGFCLFDHDSSCLKKAFTPKKLTVEFWDLSDCIYGFHPLFTDLQLDFIPFCNGCFPYQNNMWHTKITIDLKLIYRLVQVTSVVKVIFYTYITGILTDLMYIQRNTNLKVNSADWAWEVSTLTEGFVFIFAEYKQLCKLR